jgi:hypothetical protein
LSVASLGDDDSLGDRLSGLVDLLQLTRRHREVRIDECADQRHARHQVAEQPQPLRFHQIRQQSHSGHIAARPAEARDQAGGDRVAADPEHDRDGRTRGLRRESGNVTPGRHDDGHLPAHQIGGEGRQSAVVTARPAEFDGHVVPVNETALPQAGAERVEEVHGILRRPGAHVSDHRNGRLLRARGERPCGRRSAEKRNELAPLHSITSSARADRVGEISSPSAFAVFRLITNSYLVDCITGRSADLSPLSTRPV